MAPSLPPKDRVPPPAPINPFQDPPQPAYVPSPIPPKEKWWKTKRGRIILGLVIIVLIGILCGIAAGAATAKNRRGSTLLTPSATRDGANTLPSSTSSISPILPTPTPSQNSSPVPLAPSTPEVTRTTIPAPFDGPLVTTTPRLQTTRLGSGGAATTLPPGVTLPTATAPSDSDDNGGSDDDTPYICYVLPWLSECD